MSGSYNSRETLAAHQTPILNNQSPPLTQGKYFWCYAGIGIIKSCKHLANGYFYIGLWFKQPNIIK